MSIFCLRKLMDVSRARSFHRLKILLRACRHRGRSLPLKTYYTRLEDCDPSFTEALLAREEVSVGRWCRTRTEKVPRGFVPVYVGSEETRFVIPMVFLSMPEFSKLMDSTADEFGFEQEGGLKIACEEDDFEEILLKCLAYHKGKNKSGINMSLEDYSCSL
ncbi:hypothetical protein RND81_01G139200 [Saponaria officinalis]|uniref:Uncharacterized protein n=1 Tax=Saponaria officinalis TaxID=3572 RepID=A0AAW1N7H5_SAPOF